MLTILFVLLTNSAIAQFDIGDGDNNPYGGNCGRDSWTCNPMYPTGSMPGLYSNFDEESTSPDGVYRVTVIGERIEEDPNYNFNDYDDNYWDFQNILDQLYNSQYINSAFLFGGGGGGYTVDLSQESTTPESARKIYCGAVKTGYMYCQEAGRAGPGSAPLAREMGIARCKQVFRTETAIGACVQGVDQGVNQGVKDGQCFENPGVRAREPHVSDCSGS